MNKNKKLATRWYPDSIIGIAIITIFFISNIIFYIVTFQIIITTTLMLLFSSQLFSAVLMISLFILQKKKLYPDISFKGIFSWHDYQICLFILIGAIVVNILISLLFNINEVEFISGFLEKRHQFEIAIFSISVVIFAPIIEEILFRHFILAMFPFNLGGKWAAYAIVFSSLLFSLCHTQYLYTISYIFIFLIGIVLSLARIISQGLLLPILLHASYNGICLMLYFILQTG